MWTHNILLDPSIHKIWGQAMDCDQTGWLCALQTRPFRFAGFRSGTYKGWHATGALCKTPWQRNVGHLSDYDNPLGEFSRNLQQIIHYESLWYRFLMSINHYRSPSGATCFTSFQGSSRVALLQGSHCCNFYCLQLRFCVHNHSIQPVASFYGLSSLVFEKFSQTRRFMLFPSSRTIHLFIHGSSFIVHLEFIYT